MQSMWTINELVPRLAPEFGDREAMNIAKIIAEYIGEADVTGKDDIERIIERLRSGEPVQYVVGYAWFYGRRFNVGPEVLIPRPETEELVFWILEDWKHKSSLQVLDIGTGSGCISVTLSYEMDRPDVKATDISNDALSTARINASELAVNVVFIESDVLTDGLRELGRYDVVVSNPPYISIREFENLNPSVKEFEPGIALAPVSGDPLIFYRVIAEEAQLHEDGAIYVELSEFHAPAIETIFNDRGYIVEIRKDMQGKLRMLKATLQKDS